MGISVLSVEYLSIKMLLIRVVHHLDTRSLRGRQLHKLLLK